MATSKHSFEYKTVMKDIPLASSLIPCRDAIRIIKQSTLTDSVSKTHKGIRPGLREEEFKFEPNAGHNATVNHFLFTPLLTTLRPKDPRDDFVFADPIVDDRIEEEKTSAQSENLLNTVSAGLAKMLKDSVEGTKRKEKMTKTLQKPEYIPIEELKAENDRLLGNMVHIEAQFQEKKAKEKHLLNSYLNLNDEVNALEDENCNTMEGIRVIVEEEEKKTKKRTEMLKTFAMKELAKKGVFRIGYNTHRPVDDYDDKFIKKYAKYLLMKKIKDKVTGDEDDEYEREYEAYVFTANSPDSPRSLSIEKDNSKPMLKGKKASPIEEVQPQPLNDQSSPAQSFVAFIKMIFAMIDKDQNGLVSRGEIESEMRLDDKILQDLGFDSNENFLHSLHNYLPNATELNENDFLIFLLSKSEMKEDILQYLNRQSQHSRSVNLRSSRKLRKSPKAQENEIELSDDEQENLNGLKTHVYDFLCLENDKKKLDKLNEMLQETRQTAPHSQQKPKTTIVKMVNQAVQVSYHEYLTFLRRFQTKDQLNFTIPKPFEFLKRDYQHKKMMKIKEILQERVDKEDALINYRFKANKLKENIWGNRMQNIIEYERTQRRERQEKLKESIVVDMKPFSFYEADERKYRERLHQECQPPTFPIFRANAVRWMSQVNLYEDMIKKQLEERQSRVKERMDKTMKASKLPPRMQIHANELKKKAEEDKSLKKKSSTPKQRFRANPVPDFLTLQDQFESKLEAMKKAAVPTQPMPFTFHEPKKKMELRNYLDNENNPKERNPQVKTDISSVIEKMQRKPKYEPSTTKSLSLLMEARRREIEERQRKEDERMLEDELRREKQDRLRERVQTSKAIVDNKKELAENRRRIQDDFRLNLQKKKDSYDVELQRRLQKVYNRPLMVEQIGNKGEKFTLTRNMKDDLNDILFEQGEEEQSEEIGQGNEEVDD